MHSLKNWACSLLHIEIISDVNGITASNTITPPTTVYQGWRRVHGPGKTWAAHEANQLLSQFEVASFPNHKEGLGGLTFLCSAVQSSLVAGAAVGSNSTVKRVVAQKGAVVSSRSTAHKPKLLMFLALFFSVGYYVKYTCWYIKFGAFGALVGNIQTDGT